MRNSVGVASSIPVSCPDGAYGSGPEGLIDVDGDVVAFSDGVEFGAGVAPGEFIEQVALAASR